MKNVPIIILLSINDKLAIIFAEKANIFDEDVNPYPSIAVFHISTAEVGRDINFKNIKSVNLKKADGHFNNSVTIPKICGLYIIK